MKVYGWESIAIAGEGGSGKSTVSKKLGGLLNWGVFGAGSKFRSARPGESNLGAESGSEQEHDAIDAAMEERLRAGDWVVEGRVAGLVAVTHKLDKVFTILLDCAPEERYARIWKRDKKLYSSLDQVKTLTEQRERENLTMFSDRYGESYLDSSLYNLTINTGWFNLQETVKMVLGSMRNNSK